MAPPENVLDNNVRRLTGGKVSVKIRDPQKNRVRRGEVNHASHSGTA
jgi:hypothetical protein